MPVQPVLIQYPNSLVSLSAGEETGGAQSHPKSVRTFGIVVGCARGVGAGSGPLPKEDGPAPGKTSNPSLPSPLLLP